MLLLVLAACSNVSDFMTRPFPMEGEEPVVVDSGDTGLEDTGLEDTGELLGAFIGSPCTSDLDCVYSGGVCLTEGFPEGMCSLACDSTCPDAEGFPTTFCADADRLPVEARLGEGDCVSRCDFGDFPETGCREGYGCTVTARPLDPETLTYTCLPGAEDEVSGCYDELIARGVPFEPTVNKDDHPSGYPELTCSITDPVWLLPPIHGVDVIGLGGASKGRILAGCAMAHALTDTIEDVAAEGVTVINHLGTYSCRTISGTDTLSQHAFGNAIDIWGFWFEDGREFTLIEDWEHNTTSPSSEAGAWLYDAAYRWHRQALWNIILTPNYNSDHDDHFHVDLTGGSDFIGFRGPWIGPAPYVD